MIGRWTAFAYPVRCTTPEGAHEITPEQPVRVLGAVVRCARHCVLEVDWPAVDAAKLEIEAARAAGAVTPDPTQLRTPVSRMRPPQPPRSFQSIADLVGVDPKTRQAGGE